MSKIFAAQEILLNLVNLLSLPGDPTAGGGVARAIGSMYWRSGTAGAYLKTSAGNTAWTILNQSFQWYSVRDYGAVGDGVTDDRAAIQAAIDACNTAGGTYLCGKDGANPWSLNLNAVQNITFQGQGPDSVLRQSGNAGGGAYSLLRMTGNCLRVRLDSLALDGAGVTNPSTACHLLAMGTGAGTVSEIQIFRCLFGGMVVGAGDGIHMLGAAGNLVQRIWILDNVFDGCARYGVGGEQGIQNFWICENFLQNCTTEIALIASGAGILDQGVMVGNEVVHSAAGEHRAVRITGATVELATKHILSSNTIVNGCVEITNLTDSSIAGNVQTSGAYAALTTASFRLLGNVTNTIVTGNVMVRGTGAGVGPVLSLEASGGAAPSVCRLGNNTIIQEVTAAPFALLVDVTRSSFGDNLCRALNAGATTVDAVDWQAVTANIDSLQCVGNQLTASAGTFRSAFRFLVNGANIGNFQCNANEADETDVGVRVEDAGAGAFTGMPMFAGNVFDVVTTDYVAVGTTIFPFIGLNATTAGVTYRTGAGSPEGVVTARVGSIFSRNDGGQATSFYYKESGTGNTGWIGVGGSVIGFGIGDVGVAATALYFAPGFSTATAGATELQITMPRPGQLRNLRVHVTGAGTTVETVTYTVRVNGVNSALTTSLGNTSTGDVSDTTHAATVAAGDLVSVQITKSGVVVAGQTNVTVEMELV